MIDHQSSIIDHRRGFTLLEVLLTLLLTSLVLVALAMAIDFQLRVVEKGRDGVEQSQLARVLLHRIADDLRGAVPYDPLDMEKLVAEAVSSAGSSGGAASTAESAGDAAEASNGEATDSEFSALDEFGVEDVEGTESDATTGDAATNGHQPQVSPSVPAAPRSIPGVYGESDWIQVDVSRLPRLDQFEHLVTATEGSTTVDRLSDVKTVTYYVLPPEDDAASSADGRERGGGLVRRELDRAVASWASEQGPFEETDSGEPPIASEVSAIAFRYSDGTEWVDSWDSDEAGALPVAVEITLTIRPFVPEGGEPSSPQASTPAGSTEEETLLTYRLVVHLPGALSGAAASTGEESEEETEEASESTETTGSTEHP